MRIFAKLLEYPVRHQKINLKINDFNINGSGRQLKILKVLCPKNIWQDFKFGPDILLLPSLIANKTRRYKFPALVKFDLLN